MKQTILTTNNSVLVNIQVIIVADDTIFAADLVGAYGHNLEVNEGRGLIFWRMLRLCISFYILMN